MRKLSRTIILLVAIACLALSLALSGCTKHPNEKQLQALEEQRKAALAAEDQLTKCNQQKADVHREVAEKKQKLESAKSEKEMIEKKLSGM
jgi:Na+-translocating ferredoxin:NAD+ oxidoreductase RnfG subunit